MERVHFGDSVTMLGQKRKSSVDINSADKTSTLIAAPNSYTRRILVVARQSKDSLVKACSCQQTRCRCNRQQVKDSRSSIVESEYEDGNTFALRSELEELTRSINYRLFDKGRQSSLPIIPPQHTELRPNSHEISTLRSLMSAKPCIPSEEWFRGVPTLLPSLIQNCPDY